jgi:hypothetical protein
MRKCSAKLVPKCFSAAQKHDQAVASQDILNKFQWDPMEFFNRLLTTGGIWIHIYIYIYIYDPEI